MDWVMKKLIDYEHILAAKLSQTQRLIQRREEILHERIATHVWENEGGNIQDTESE